jgi:hypothetical protein
LAALNAKAIEGETKTVAAPPVCSTAAPITQKQHSVTINIQSTEEKHKVQAQTESVSRTASQLVMLNDMKMPSMAQHLLLVSWVASRVH